MKEYESRVSDETVNKKIHARLVDEVFQLDKRQYIKKPSRTEPTFQISEFHLAKSKTGRKPLINVNDLAKSLKKKDKHVSVNRKVRNAQVNTKTLITPASKTEADKIRRTIGFEKVSSELGKWEAIVEKNRVASHITFPLNQHEVEFADSKETRNEYQPRYKSELDIELEKLEPIAPAKETKAEFPLSMQELIERRKEMAKLRAHQSYLEAKAYKKNKIKSKTFHKIDRKAKLKEKIKEFEILKKTNPEAALEKLEELEKVRAEERMSLRHRSTGQWARNKHIQAKYNKESRQALAQQLALSRELTQKMKVNDSSDSETDGTEQRNPIDTSNPWTVNKSNEVEEFITGYRKFWNQQNKKNCTEQASESTKIKNTEEGESYTDSHEKDVIANDNVSQSTETYNSKNNTETKKRKLLNKELISHKKKKVKTKSNKKDTKVNYCNSSWNIEDLFDHLEQKQKKNFEDKLTELKVSTKKKRNENKNVDLKDKSKISDLSMPREKLRPEIDEELGRNELNENEINNIIKLSYADSVDVSDKNIHVDPNKYAHIKTVDLDTVLPTVNLEDENVEENDQRAFISEAFEDDDIVTEFSKEKQSVIDKEKPQSIDLNLPGWGSWGGKDIQTSKRKHKRFIVKVPEELPRKDKNRLAVIINEKKNIKLNSHRVSDLPFPFTTVKDFEASIRAPIGDTFVPQTAFKKLIKPAVVVKQGAIVEPMSKEILLKHKFTENGMLIPDKKLYFK